MPTNLPDNLAPQLADLARSLSASKLVLFGSRARGDHHERSDIDLAVYGMRKRTVVSSGWRPRKTLYAAED